MNNTYEFLPINWRLSICHPCQLDDKKVVGRCRYFFFTPFALHCCHSIVCRYFWIFVPLPITCARCSSFLLLYFLVGSLSPVHIDTLNSRSIRWKEVRYLYFVKTFWYIIGFYYHLHTTYIASKLYCAYFV